MTPPAEAPKLSDTWMINTVSGLRHWTGSIRGRQHTCKCEECRAIKRVCALACEAIAMRASRRASMKEPE